MSFSVYFNNVNKVENSTKAFSTSGLTAYDCVLKNGCSVSNPTIEIQVSFSDFASLSANNMAYIPDFSRYYFVTDWRYTGRLAICTLAVDVLASFWGQLSAQSFYVTRSASASDIHIVDTAYPASAYHRTQYVDNYANPFQPASNDYGCFIVGVTNKYGGLDGCVTYYCMGYLVFMNFMSKVFTIGSYGTTGTNNDTLTQDLAEAITRPMQYVASIMWYPFSTSTLNSLGFLASTSTIYYGYSSLTITGTLYEFDNSVLHKNVCDKIELTIYQHPDHNDVDSFLNLAPWSEYRFSFYPFGTFNIDGKYLQGCTKLYCLYNVDLRTGRATLNVGTSMQGTSGADYVMPEAFLTTEAQIGVPIPTSTVETLIPDLGVIATAGIIGSASGEFSGFNEIVKTAYTAVKDFANWLGTGQGRREGAITGLPASTIDTSGSLADDIGSLLNKSGIGSALQQALASPTIGGSQGAVSLYPKQQVSLSCWFMGRSGLDNTHKGSPLCQVVQLSTLQGFTICSSAVAEITGATFAEKRKIESYLNTGFYIIPDNFFRILQQPVDFHGSATAYFYILAENVVDYRWYYSSNNGVTWTALSADTAMAPAISIQNNATNRSRLYQCRMYDGQVVHYSNNVRMYNS